MDEANAICLKDRKQWRSWLRKNHAIEREIWLVIYKKNTGKPSLTYEEAVEEAVCFGWIDGRMKSIDDEKYNAALFAEDREEHMVGVQYRESREDDRRGKDDGGRTQSLPAGSERRGLRYHPHPDPPSPRGREPG